VGETSPGPNNGSDADAVLCALAVFTHVSIMLAGFALGLVISAIGEPRRLARQLFGITEGFFSPLFFVWLGASL
jgi:Kef-type K+ transport system membrane component KefB